MWLRNVLPRHHLDAESRDTVKVGIGFIATMTALVLGLVTASAKSSFDAVNTAVKQTSANILSLDRLLARYGPETGGIRSELQQLVRAKLQEIWQEEGGGEALDPTKGGTEMTAEDLVQPIRALDPHDDSQRALKTRALELVESILQTRWFMLVGGETVPLPFLGILLFWLTITFTSFGLYAPRNFTVLAILFVCAASVSSALFLVLEMDGPFDGLIKASAGPLRYALTHINR
ncbi:MAG TPA: hypothetical protein VFW45_01615 [Candidatus Polarisedimenticolia bacterium]|nr:hypothetical protein [Candidatus Polarisedimenticolia bacterium]